MAKHIQCPDTVKTEAKNKLFLAGGISGCFIWQTDVIKALADVPDLDIYNPRRVSFPMHEPAEAVKQITWEFERLRDSNIISFWFAPETLCPIVLFELGMWGLSRPEKKIIVGIHPEYKRRKDVETQVLLANDKIPVVYSLKDLVTKIKEVAV